MKIVVADASFRNVRRIRLKFDKVIKSFKSGSSPLMKSGRETANKIKDDAKSIVRAEAYHTGTLHDSIVVVETPKGKGNVDFRIGVLTAETMQFNGFDYSKSIESGAARHFVTVHDKPHLQEWIEDKLGSEALDRAMYTGIYVSNKDVRFMERAFTANFKIIGKNLRTQVRNMLSEAGFAI